MATLSTSYVDATWSGNRKYSITNNADNTISLTDETEYIVEGSTFGASDINNTNKQVNGISGAATVNIAVADWSSSTTTVNDIAYHTVEKTFTDIYTENPIIALGAANTIPTDDEEEAFSLIEAAIANTTTKKIKFYCQTIPSTALVLIVRGAS